jgi:hypothetical protein
MSCRLVIAALALIAVPVASAAAADYSTLSFREPASAGLPVRPPLDELRAVSGARVLIPAAWTRRPATSSGRPRYLITRNRECRFRVTWSVRTVVADPGSAESQLDAAIAAGARARVYEQGVRNGRPWRVVRLSGAARTSVRGAWVGVLTRRADIVPAGKTVWTQIIADARAGAADECHAGMVRNAARDIADGLALARNRLRFAEP